MSYLSDFLMIPLPGASVVDDNLTWSKSIAQFTLVATSNVAADAPIFNLVNSMPGTGNGGVIRWYAQNTAPASFLAGLIKGSLVADAEGAESGKLDFVIPIDGSGRTVSLDGSLATFGSSATGVFSLGANTARWNGLAIGNQADTYKGDFMPDEVNLGIAVQATSAHPLLLKANNIVGLRIETTGLVTVGVADGTAQVGIAGDSLVSGTTGYGLYVHQTLPAAMTALHAVLHTAPSTAASAYTLVELDHLKVTDVVVGAGSVVTTQIGLNIGALAGAVTNIGLKLNVAAGANNYNLYVSGTAQNYFGGDFAADFTNATHANRSLFVTSTAASATHVGAAPSASGTGASYLVYGAPDPDNSAYGQMYHDGTNLIVQSQKTGTGTAGMIKLVVGSNTTAVEVETNGDVRLGSNALVAAATAGHTYLPSFAGTMTGVPTARSGSIPIVIDSTLFKIGMYVSGAWKWTPALT